MTSMVSHDGRVSIDPDSGVPAYRQLATILVGRIASGDITRRLPSENTLMQQYRQALGTVRHALAVLRDEGVVFTTPGLGTFLAQKGAEEAADYAGGRRPAPRPGHGIRIVAVEARSGELAWHKPTRVEGRAAVADSYS